MNISDMATRCKILISVFIISIVFTSVGIMAQESKNNEYPIKISIELPDTIYLGQGNALIVKIPIVLKIENTTSKVLSISNPKGYGHIYTSLKKREMRGRMGELIITSINVIKIKEYETIRVELGSLDSYPLESQLGKHEIYLKYYYEPKKVFKQRNKQLVKSVTEKFIISDVFTFYILEKREKDNFPDLLRHIR